MYMHIKRYATVVAIAIPLVALGTIIILSLLAPYLEYRRINLSQNLYSITHFICHQIPTRCLWIKTSNMGLCARCFAIYTSLLLTGIYYLIRRVRAINILRASLLIIPCLIEGLFQAKTSYVSNNILRLILGAAAGVGMGTVLFPYYYRVLHV